jgi:hypothetical protein
MITVEHAKFLERELILAQLAGANVVDRYIARRRRHVAAESFMNVDFPEPLAPMRPYRCPQLTETFSNNGLRPNQS